MRWLLRRPIRTVASGSGSTVPIAPISYGRDQVAFVWIVMALTVVEIVVVEVIVPWPALRWLLLVLGAYGLLVIAGFAAANRTRPHILTGDSLHLHWGQPVAVAVPLELVDSVTVGLRSAEYGPIIVGDTLSLGVAGSTQVAVHLTAAIPLRAGKAAGEVRIILFAADDPTRAATLIRTHLPDADGIVVKP